MKLERTEGEDVIFAALSRVETPEYDVEGAVRSARSAGRRRRRRPMPRVALIAACLTGVLVIAAAAVGLTVNLGSFFANPVPTAAVAQVMASQTAGEYTLAVQDAVVDDNGAMLLLALSRADGAAIDPSAGLWTNSMGLRLLADGEGISGQSGMEGEPQRSEDGKTLYFCFETKNLALQGDASLIGRTLTLTADGVAELLREPDGYYQLRADAPTSLAPLAERASGEAIPCEVRDAAYRASLAAAVEAQNVSLPLAGDLAEAFPGYRLRGALTTEDGLAVAISWPSGQDGVRSGDRLCTQMDVAALVDTRDGTRYELGQSTGVHLSDGTGASLWSFQDCPLTTAALPYLEIEPSYAVDRILSDQPFSIDFKVEQSAALTVRVDRDIGVTGLTLHLTELRLSPLGIFADFTDADEAFRLYETQGAPVLTLDDGTEIETEWQGGSGRGGEDGGSGVVEFRVKDTSTWWTDRIFFDTAAIRSVTFGDAVIAVK